MVPAHAPLWRHLAGKESSVSDLSGGEAIVIREACSGNRQAMEREFAKHEVNGEE